MSLLFKIIRILAGCIFSLLVILGLITLISNTLITTSHYSIRSAKLPAAFDGYKIVQLSDLHNKAFGEDNERLLKKIAAEEPDIIVMTGDMTDDLGPANQVFLNLAQKLVESYPVYYIVGNHEQNFDQAGLENLCATLREMGLVVLDNQMVRLEKDGQSIHLYGMWFNLRYYRDLTSQDSADYYFDLKHMEEILGYCDREAYNILLTHNPVYFDTYCEWGADLTLSGHIHGGMIRIPFKGGLFSPEKELFPEYDAGLFTKGEQAMIVSRGLGNGTIGFRFWNCPDLVSITLHQQ